VKNFEDTRGKEIKKNCGGISMAELKQVTVGEEKFFYSLSFDIDDFIGDGIWWLQIYDSNQNIIYDRPFTSSVVKIDTRKIKEIIKQEFLTYQGESL